VAPGERAYLTVMLAPPSSLGLREDHLLWDWDQMVTRR